MAGIEASALKLGGTIATQAAKSWLQRRKAKFERSAELTDLAAAELKGPLERRKLDNLIDAIGTQVAEQLAPVLADRFSSLPENEFNAAFVAVESALAKTDLSDEALLADDADPEKLARRIRAALSGPELLAPRAAALYELALDLSCRHLIEVVRYLPSFASRALPEVLSRLSRQGVQLDELLERVPKTSLSAPAGSDHDAEFQADYLSLLARKLDRLELLGLTMDDQPALPLTVAYLSLSVSPQAGPRPPERRPDELWFEKRQKRDVSATMRVETALGGETRILIRGEAGSGKTTLLDWLAVTAARRGFTGKLEEWNGHIPFPIRLRSFSAEPLPRPEQFVEHIAPALAGKMPPNWVGRVLESGHALVLVDGVDEVGASHRRNVKAWLRELTLAFPETRFVVTSRTAAADRRWLAQENFGCVQLEQMSADDIQALVERWHQAALAGGTVRHDTDVPAVQRRLLNQLDSRPHLRMLAASPLLCAMLCALNLAHRSELPRDRMDLYRKALSMLLHLRDAERQIDVLLTEAQKEVLLGDLAWRLTLASKVELPRAKAREHVARRLPSLPHVDHTVDEVLDHLLERSGVLREPVRGRVDFVHRTFQECLAANEATEQDYLDVLVDRAHLDTWWETVVMACGHAKSHQVGEVLGGILDRADAEPRYARHLRLLGAACLETVSNTDPEVLARVESVIQDQLVPPRSMRETRSLASIGPRVLRYLPENLEGLSDAVASASVRAAALTAGNEALRLLRSYARDPRSVVQDQLTLAWHYFDPEQFAAEVLADSPLDNGRALIRSARLLPYAIHLQNLTNLQVDLPSSDEHGDLDFLNNVPHVRWLAMQCKETTKPLNLATLADHPEFESAGFFSAFEFTGFKALSTHPELNSLFLASRRHWKTLEPLDKLTNLDTLFLSMVQEVHLDPLAELPKLARLQLWGFTENTFSASRPIVQPKSVSLYNPAETDISAREIARIFPNVKNLSIHEFEVGKLDPLTDLPLTRIEMEGSPIDDLAPLTRIPTLREITITHPGAMVDVTPLSALELTLQLQSTQCVGLDQLGPGVKVKHLK